MFKSIEYLTYAYDSKTHKYTYYYHLVDSDFECDISVETTSIALASPVATEYYKRGSDVVRNIYLLNIYTIERFHFDYTFIDVLDWQKDYIDECCPIKGLSFSNDIYPKVKELYETFNMFK